MAILLNYIMKKADKKEQSFLISLGYRLWLDQSLHYEIGLLKFSRETIFNLDHILKSV